MRLLPHSLELRALRPQRSSLGKVRPGGQRTCQHLSKVTGAATTDKEPPMDLYAVIEQILAPLAEDIRLAYDHFRES